MSKFVAPAIGNATEWVALIFVRSTSPLEPLLSWRRFLRTAPVGIHCVLANADCRMTAQRLAYAFLGGVLFFHVVRRKT